QVNNFSENDSKCITYYDGNTSYIFWKGVEYQISQSLDYKYYLIDENTQLFYNNMTAIYNFQFNNNQVSKQNYITIDQDFIFSQLLTVSGYPNQIIVVYTNSQLQLFDTATLQSLFTILNSQISQAQFPAMHLNIILTYQNIIIVGTTKYTLTYQNNAFSSQSAQINNQYQLPCTNNLYRRTFFSIKSQILSNSTNTFFITMDDLVCSPGQYMDSYNQVCVPCPQNCSSCQSTQQCLICMSGFNLTNGFCQLANCQTLLAADQCSVCVSGYALSNGLCFQQITNCQTYSFTGQCTTCISGYDVSNGVCITQIVNCQTYSNTNQCSACISGYTVSNGVCIAQIANCQTYSSTGQCTACVQGYFLSQTNTDQLFDASSQNCISCIKDMTNNGQCVANCASNQYYDKVNQQCQKCSIEFQCKPSIPCNNQQYFDQNQLYCISCDKSCLTCQGPLSTDCKQCQNQYVLIEGKCVKNCEIGQYFDEGSQSCKICNGDNKKQCTYCQLGSFYDKGSKTCLNCDVSCKTCEGAGINQCTSCFQDAIFTSGFCQYCNDGFFYDPKQLSCVQCDKSCKTCKGGSNSDCLSCNFNFSLDKAKNQCKTYQSGDYCQNISVYNEEQFNQCFQGYEFAQISSTCLQFLILSSILLSLLLICISPLYSPVSWCYLQIQQLIGNYIFSPYINILQINHYHLKYSYMHNLFNIIPNFLSQSSSYQFNLNLLNTFVNVQNFSNNYFNNCFYQILIFLVACFISLILLIKQKFFPKITTRLVNYINWNYMIGAIRLISNFIIFTFFLLLSSKSSFSLIDYSFFSAFATIYSLFNYLLLSKLKSIDQYGQVSNLQLVSLASVGTEKIHFLTRVFWIGFELRKLIVAIIQGALLFSIDNYKSVPWIHFIINSFYQLLIIKYSPFILKINNVMLTLMETFHVLLIFQISMVTSTNNEPKTLEQPFLQNNKNSQIFFGYIFIALMALFEHNAILFQNKTSWYYCIFDEIGNPLQIQGLNSMNTGNDSYTNFDYLIESNNLNVIFDNQYYLQLTFNGSFYITQISRFTEMSEIYCLKSFLFIKYPNKFKAYCGHNYIDDELYSANSFDELLSQTGDFISIKQYSTINVYLYMDISQNTNFILWKDNVFQIPWYSITPYLCSNFFYLDQINNVFLCDSYLLVLQLDNSTYQATISYSKNVNFDQYFPTFSRPIYFQSGLKVILTCPSNCKTWQAWNIDNLNSIQLLGDSLPFISDKYIVQFKNNIVIGRNYYIINEVSGGINVSLQSQPSINVSYYNNGFNTEGFSLVPSLNQVFAVKQNGTYYLANSYGLYGLYFPICNVNYCNLCQTSSYSKCQTCSSPYFLNYDFACLTQCQSTFQIDSTNKMCVCDSNASLINDPNNIQQKICQCNQGYFMNMNTFQCSNSCPATYLIDTSNKICICPQYASESLIQNTNQKQCVCNSSYYRYQSKCIQTCPNTYIQGTNPPSCICDQNAQEIQNNSMYMCQCNNGYFLTYNNKCSQNCPATFKSDSTNKICYCDQNATQVIGPLNSQAFICQCNNGYFMDIDSNCLTSCPSTFLQNQQNNTCTCSSNAIVDQAMKKCQCYLGYYMQYDYICSNTCYDTYIADKTNKVCICPPNSSEQSNNSKKYCQCLNGYNLQPDKLSCSQSCPNTYQIISQACKCDSNSNETIINGVIQCQCNSGYYMINNYCCQQDQVFQNNQCQYCQDGTYKVDSTNCGQCKNYCDICTSLTNCVKYKACPKGQIIDLDQEVCVPCIKDLQNNIDCVYKCSTGQYFNQIKLTCSKCYYLNGTCLEECPDNYYQDQIYFTCVKCSSPFCQKCQGPLDSDCTQCYFGLNLDQFSLCGICQTENGYFIKNNKCIPCQDQCLQCIDENNCIQQLQCNLNQIYNPSIKKCQNCILDLQNQNQCVLSCKYDQFFDSYAMTCSQCFYQFNDMFYKCQKSCNQGFYHDDQFYCQPCDQSCLTCNGPSPQNCISCKNDSILTKQNSCINCLIESGQFIDKSYQCQNCPKKCLKCTDSSNCQKQLVCSSNTIYDEKKNQCLPCLYDQSNNMQCVLECKPKIQIISQGSMCQKCYVQDGICQLNCNYGYYPDDSINSDVYICLPCSPPCKTCAKGSNQCTSCQNGLVLNDKFQCGLCQNGQYYEEEAKSCQQCESHCANCDGPLENNCLSCYNGFTFNKKTKQCETASQAQNSNLTENLYLHMNCTLSTEECQEKLNNIVANTQIYDKLQITALSLSLFSCLVLQDQWIIYWSFILMKQEIGNFLFSENLSYNLLDFSFLKSDFSLNLFNQFEFQNPFRQQKSNLTNADIIYIDLKNRVNSSLNVNSIYYLFADNCFFQSLICFGATLFLLVITLIKSKIDFIKNNLAFLDLRIIFLVSSLSSNMIIVSFVVATRKYKVNGTIDICLLIITATWYAFIQFLFAKSLNNHMSNSLSQDRSKSNFSSFLLIGINSNNFISRYYWTIFELRRVISTALIIIFSSFQSSQFVYAFSLLFFLIYSAVFQLFKNKVINMTFIVIIFMNIMQSTLLGLISMYSGKESNKDLIVIFYKVYFIAIVAFDGVFILIMLSHLAYFLFQCAFLKYSNKNYKKYTKDEIVMVQFNIENPSQLLNNFQSNVFTRQQLSLNYRKINLRKKQQYDLF
ncbi:hypothetical protein ABPG72_007817, partial [Tetrahymena utriculariae]